MAGIRMFLWSAVAEQPDRFLMCSDDVWDQLKITIRDRSKPPRGSSHQILRYEPTAREHVSITSRNFLGHPRERPFTYWEGNRAGIEDDICTFRGWSDKLLLLRCGIGVHTRAGICSSA